MKRRWQATGIYSPVTIRVFALNFFPVIVTVDCSLKVYLFLYKRTNNRHNENSCRQCNWSPLDLHL